MSLPSKGIMRGSFFKSRSRIEREHTYCCYITEAPYNRVERGGGWEKVGHGVSTEWYCCSSFLLSPFYKPLLLVNNWDSE